MRKVSIIVLLLWAVCYGRCLAEQYGAQDFPEPQQAWCAQCGHEEKPDVPSPAPPTPCGVCDFIHSGGTPPSSRMVLEVPVFFSLPDSGREWFISSSAVWSEPLKELAGPDTGPSSLPRMCEWFATATPVRGPNQA